MRRILSLYILREILPPFLFGLLAFTFILLIARILRLVELVVTRGVPLLQIGKLFALILPTFLEITIPMALLLGVLLGLGRLSGDREVLALKATGNSPLHMLIPIGLLAFAVCCGTLVITAWLRPAANLALKKELYQIAKSRVATALKEKIFNDDFPKVLIYVEEVIPPGTTSRGVLIIDRRTPGKENIIFGKTAFMVADEEAKAISLRLLDGAVYERPKKKLGFSQTRFNTYDFTLDLEEAFSPVRKKERGPKEMSLRRLTRTIQLKAEQGLRPTAELVEYHQRFSFSFTPLLFSLLGVSLITLPTRSPTGRSWGFAWGLSWLLAYYALLSLGKALGERAILPAVVALWLPNIVLALIALYLFRKAVKESPLLIQTKLEDFSLYVRRRLARQSS